MSCSAGYWYCITGFTDLAAFGDAALGDVAAFYFYLGIAGGSYYVPVSIALIFETY
jgi:hypothetical protein